MRRLTEIKQKLSDALGLMTLSSIPHGAAAQVVEIGGAGAWRLMEMGLVPGASVSVIRSAPLGDPLQICVRSYHLALRRVDAEKITVFLRD